MKLEKYTFGVGDRFGKQGKAQLEAFRKALKAGVSVVPVWNKSHREHEIIGTGPGAVRAEADGVTDALSWDRAYFVDADHIGLGNVDLFIEASDFFTLDVAECIGQRTDHGDVDRFVDYCGKYTGNLEIPGISEQFEVTEDEIRKIADTFLGAVKQAGRIYRHIENRKGRGNFVVEVSMDEAEAAQTPLEMFFILAAISQEGIPAQTIAPKFTGRFNKGVDYVGDVRVFASEFDNDISVISYAVREFRLPENLKLSVHSGSDKFSIYEPMQKALRKHDAGLHLKTAGTTWLEELIGLAEAEGRGLAVAKQVYAQSLKRYEELCEPYAPVIDIDRSSLPDLEDVGGWSGEEFALALRHDQDCKDYNPNFRQLLHVAYKIAAEMGEDYFDALEEFEESIAGNVTQNIFDRHMVPLFGIETG